MIKLKQKLYVIEKQTVKNNDKFENFSNKFNKIIKKKKVKIQQLLLKREKNKQDQEIEHQILKETRKEFKIFIKSQKRKEKAEIDVFLLPTKNFLKKNRSKYLKRNIEIHRKKDGGVYETKLAQPFNDNKLFKNKIRRIRGLKFYYDDVIYGFDITYTDYKERTYIKSHINYQKPLEEPKNTKYIKTPKKISTNVKIGKEVLKTKSLDIPEWDYISIVKGEYDTHITYLMIKTHCGKVFIVGKSNPNLHGGQSFLFQIFKGERPISCYGILSPTASSYKMCGLALFGIEVRVMKGEDYQREDVRKNASSIIQREWRKSFRYKEVKIEINKRILIKKNAAARIIQREWQKYCGIMDQKHESATVIQLYWRRRRRVKKSIECVNKRIEKRKIKAIKIIIKQWRAYIEKLKKEREELEKENEKDDEEEEEDEEENEGQDEEQNDE